VHRAASEQHGRHHCAGQRACAVVAVADSGHHVGGLARPGAANRGRIGDSAGSDRRSGSTQCAPNPKAAATKDVIEPPSIVAPFNTLFPVTTQIAAGGQRVLAAARTGWLQRARFAGDAAPLCCAPPTSTAPTSTAPTSTASSPACAEFVASASVAASRIAFLGRSSVPQPDAVIIAAPRLRCASGPCLGGITTYFGVWTAAWAAASSFL
jgi:hypothetical protein